MQATPTSKRTTPTMFSADGILGRNFAIISAGMDGISMRQEAHAENLANIDTEGYRARTVNFEDVLSHAINTDDRGPSSLAGGGGAGGVKDAISGSNFSTHFTSSERHGASAHVDRTQETSEMMNDNVRYRVLSQQVANRLQELKGVISEMGRG